MVYQGHEYSRPSVTSNGCNYSTLHSYNMNYFGRGAVVGAPRLSQTSSPETVVIPSFGGLGYRVLEHGVRVPSCSGYFDIESAYPSWPNACGRFSSRLCG